MTAIGVFNEFSNIIIKEELGLPLNDTEVKIKPAEREIDNSRQTINLVSVKEELLLDGDTEVKQVVKPTSRDPGCVYSRGVRIGFSKPKPEGCPYQHRELRNYMNRHLIKSFIDAWRGEPCLWQTSNPGFKNKPARHAARARILGKIKTFWRDATHKSIIDKMKNLRTAYTREQKKLAEGNSLTDGTLTTRLWYYDRLKFLGEKNMSTEVHTSSQPDHVMEEREYQGALTEQHLDTSIQSSSPEPQPCSSCKRTFSHLVPHLSTQEHNSAEVEEVEDINQLSPTPSFTESPPPAKKTKKTDMYDSQLASVVSSLNTIAAKAAATDPLAESFGVFLQNCVGCVKNDYARFSIIMETTKYCTTLIREALAKEENVRLQPP